MEAVAAVLVEAVALVEEVVAVVLVEEVAVVAAFQARPADLTYQECRTELVADRHPLATAVIIVDSWVPLEHPHPVWLPLS